MAVAVLWDIVLLVLAILSVTGILMALQLKTYINRLVRVITRLFAKCTEKCRPKWPESAPLRRVQLATDEPDETKADDEPESESKSNSSQRIEGVSEDGEDVQDKVDKKIQKDALAADVATDQEDLGTIVESKSCQTDKGEPIEVVSERLRQSNLHLFQHGRQLQLENKRILKKLALARIEAARAQPNLKWKRNKIDELKAALAEIDDANTELAMANQKQQIEQLAAKNK